MMPWLFYIPARLLLSPLIWWDQYQRRYGLKPDKWYWADKWLAERGHYVAFASGPYIDVVFFFLFYVLYCAVFLLIVHALLDLLGA